MLDLKNLIVLFADTLQVCDFCLSTLVFPAALNLFTGYLYISTFQFLVVFLFFLELDLFLSFYSIFWSITLSIYVFINSSHPSLFPLGTNQLIEPATTLVFQNFLNSDIVPE